jgi:hypothetical protein
MKEQVCEHCERMQFVDEIGLCPACNKMEGIRTLYEHGRGWTPEWDAHLHRLAQRAKARLPLFENGAPSAHKRK